MNPYHLLLVHYFKLNYFKVPHLRHTFEISYSSIYFFKNEEFMTLVRGLLLCR